MKIGDRVKVRCRDEVWRSGTVLGERHIAPPVSTTVYKIGYGEHSSYVESEFERHDLKSFREISDEEFNAAVSEAMPKGLALAQEAVAALLPGETVVFKDADNVISGYHGAVTIDPVVHEYPSIGAITERASYQVTEWKYYHSTRTQPEEYVDAPVGTYPNIGQAVQVFIETIFKLKAKDYWDHKADESQAAEWEKNNAGARRTSEDTKVKLQLQKMGGERAKKILQDLLNQLSGIDVTDMTTFELGIIHRIAENPPAKLPRYGVENK